MHISPHRPNDFLVFSNCKSVALVIDGNEIIRKFADSGATHGFDRTDKTAVLDNYWAEGGDHIEMSTKDCPLARHARLCMFKSGDCEKLEYPPFSFVNQNLDGKTIDFLGYDEKGVRVASFNKTAYSKALKLEIYYDDYGINLQPNGTDFVWLRINALDKIGQVDYKFNEKICITVDGGNTIYTNEIDAEAGSAVFMLRATSNVIKITAKSVNFVASKTICL